MLLTNAAAAACAEQLSAACAKACPKLKQPRALYDGSWRDPHYRDWRCYSSSAITDGRYDGKSKLISTQPTKLLTALQTCNRTATQPELEEWSHAANASTCAGGATGQTLPPAPVCLDPASCSAFARVALVLQVTRVERVPLLLGYRHWFASVWLAVVGPQAECDACARNVTAAGSNTSGVHCECVTAGGEGAYKARPPSHAQ